MAVLIVFAPKASLSSADPPALSDGAALAGLRFNKISSWSHQIFKSGRSTTTFLRNVIVLRALSKIASSKPDICVCVAASPLLGLGLGLPPASASLSAFSARPALSARASGSFVGRGSALGVASAFGVAFALGFDAGGAAGVVLAGLTGLAA